MKQTAQDSTCTTNKKWCHKCISMAFALVVVITGAVIMRDGLINIQKNRETVTVKGLAEKVVRADSAIWIIPINVIGDDFEEVKNKVDMDVTKITEFLKKYNIKETDIESDAMRIYDKLAQRYYDENNKAKRFSIDHQLIVKSNDVDAVLAASKNVNELLKDGITMAYDGYNGSYSSPRYLFTKLNEIKPEMLSSAMKEAKKAADELVTSSDAQVGRMKSATQGMFSIYSREATGSGANIDQRAAYGGNGQYSSNEAYFVEKVVRIVANVEYYLEQ